MFMYENLDQWQKDDRSKASQALEKAACEKEGRTYYPAVLRGPHDYRGLLDDLLPEEQIRLRASVLQGVPTGELNQHGANMCDFTRVEITAEITEPMTLREALPALEAAWQANTEALGAEEGHYFIEGMELLQDDDGTPVLYMSLGT